MTKISESEEMWIDGHELYIRATKLARDRVQTVDADGKYYVTLEQLMNILRQLEP